MKQLPREPTYHIEATRVLDLIESDFGQSGADVRHEAIRCELVSAYRHGLAAAPAVPDVKTVTEFATQCQPTIGEVIEAQNLKVVELEEENKRLRQANIGSVEWYNQTRERMIELEKELDMNARSVYSCVSADGFDELARRNKLLEEALKDSDKCLRLFYELDEDNKSNPSMQSVGRSLVKSEKALKQNRGGE